MRSASTIPERLYSHTAPCAQHHKAAGLCHLQWMLARKRSRGCSASLWPSGVATLSSRVGDTQLMHVTQSCSSPLSQDVHNHSNDRLNLIGTQQQQAASNNGATQDGGVKQGSTDHRICDIRVSLGIRQIMYNSGMVVYKVGVTVNRQGKHIGCFDSEAEARRVYDMALHLLGRTPHYHLDYDYSTDPVVQRVQSLSNHDSSGLHRVCVLRIVLTRWNEASSISMEGMKAKRRKGQELYHLYLQEVFVAEVLDLRHAAMLRDFAYWLAHKNKLRSRQGLLALAQQPFADLQSLALALRCAWKASIRDMQSSAYVGVCWDKTIHKWQSKTSHNKQRFYLGAHDDESHAAYVYDVFFAVLDPDGHCDRPYNLGSAASYSKDPLVQQLRAQCTSPVAVAAALRSIAKHKRSISAAPVQ